MNRYYYSRLSPSAFDGTGSPCAHRVLMFVKRAPLLSARRAYLRPELSNRNGETQTRHRLGAENLKSRPVIRRKKQSHQGRPDERQVEWSGFLHRHRQKTFDAKIFAIMRAVRFLVARQQVGRDFVVFTDSQAAMRGIASDDPGSGQDLARESIE